jgi:hypothetical protein
VCPGPVASEIARDAPWPINELVIWGMRQAFQTSQRAALPVVKLALEGTAAFASAHQTSSSETEGWWVGSKSVHFHMSEARPAADEAADEVSGDWLWDITAAAFQDLDKLDAGH